MKHHVIYVPGLGDQRSYGQTQLLQFWRLFGLIPHYHPVGWARKESFKPKLQRLLNLIDDLDRQGHKVSLVGVSAGASAVLTAYSQKSDKLAGVVCISGKIQNGQTIGRQVYQHNPAFKESMSQLPSILAKLTDKQRQRIMSIHPKIDHTVPPADTIIPGAIEKQVPVRGHVLSIFYCLVFCPSAIAFFLKEM